MKKEGEIDLAFADRLYDLMYEANDSCPKLADYLHRERKTIISWRNGYSAPDLISIKRICIRYKVNADWLLFGNMPKYQRNELDEFLSNSSGMSYAEAQIRETLKV